jgi:hypothetical protein
MRLPAPIVEHPIESVIAGLLLAALLFISGGAPETAPAPLGHAAQTVAEKT